LSLFLNQEAAVSANDTYAIELLRRFTDLADTFGGNAGLLNFEQRFRYVSDRFSMMISCSLGKPVQMGEHCGPEGRESNRALTCFSASASRILKQILRLCCATIVTGKDDLQGPTSGAAVFVASTQPVRA
jgi:hypothetical protein